MDRHHREAKRLRIFEREAGSASGKSRPPCAVRRTSPATSPEAMDARAIRVCCAAGGAAASARTPTRTRARPIMRSDYFHTGVGLEAPVVCVPCQAANVVLVGLDRVRDLADASGPCSARASVTGPTGRGSCPAPTRIRCWCAPGSRARGWPGRRDRQLGQSRCGLRPSRPRFVECG